MIDKNGFPLRTCTRCGGSGQYSYNRIDGSMCYGCNGRGTQPLNDRVAKARQEFRDAIWRERYPKIHELRAGDEVTRDFLNLFGKHLFYSDSVWRIVESVKFVGVDQNGDEVFEVSFTDGTTYRGNRLQEFARRRWSVDPAPYVAKATGRG